MMTGLWFKQENKQSLTLQEKENIKDVYESTLTIFKAAICNPELMNELAILLKQYRVVDSEVRDSTYNWIIRNLVKKHNETATVIVVGANHVKAIELGLQDRNVDIKDIRHAQETAVNLFSNLNELVIKAKEEIKD